MVPVKNGHWQSTSNTETELRYPRCFKKSVLRNCGQRPKCYLSSKLPAALYRTKISVPYFDKLHLSGRVFPFQNAQTEILKGISAKQLSCCFYKFAPKDIAVIRGIKHTFAQSYGDNSLFSYSAFCFLPNVVYDGVEYWSLEGSLFSVVPSILPSMLP